MQAQNFYEVQTLIQIYTCSSLGGSLQLLSPALYEGLDDFQIVPKHTSVVMVTVLHQVLQQTVRKILILKRKQQETKFQRTVPSQGHKKVKSACCIFCKTATDNGELQYLLFSPPILQLLTRTVSSRGGPRQSSVAPPPHEPLPLSIGPGQATNTLHRAGISGRRDMEGKGGYG